jgi:hypothetical protein
VQAECGPGLAQASDIDILSTLRDDNIINVHSSSSYELFLFSSKADSAHERGGSSSVSVDDHWPEAKAAVENFRGEDTLATTNCGHLEASSSRM